MTTVVKSLFFFILLHLITVRCANPITPTGGPKDTIPPTLTSSIPPDQTTNYKDQTFTLEFSENISADRLKTDLVITPRTDISFQHIVKKNRLIMKFEEAFPDSTTFTFNFVNGVTDITERNPVSNLSLAFSTGSFIDSLRISGFVSGTLDQKPRSGFLVGLYAIHDSLDLFKEKPIYFGQTDEQGQFAIQNIKSGIYQLITFDDDNGNALLESQNEEHGFLSDTIKLTNHLDSINIKTQLLDLSPLELLSARPFGPYFEIRYSKPVTQYSIEQLSTIPSFHKLVDDKVKFQFFLPDSSYLDNDSIPIILNVFDTINSSLSDTIFLKFQSSSRKVQPADFSYYFNVTPNDSIIVSIKSTKPVRTILPDSFLLRFDSTFYFPFKPQNDPSFNQSKTSVTMKSFFDWTVYSDSVNAYIYQNIADTTTSDSVKYTPRTFNSVQFNSLVASLITVDYDSSSYFTKVIRSTSPDDFGTIHVSIDPSSPPHILQLLNSSNEIITERYSEYESVFSSLKPNKYQFRILIDENADSLWLPGNLLLSRDPEPVYLYPNTTELRSNWEILIEDISF
jgi:hypothetical protein